MLSSIYLKLTGWTVAGSFPAGLKKYVVIVGPHTSNWDFILGLALRSKLGLQHFKFLGKQELFRKPFGFLFRKWGGFPVNRSGSQNMVDQVVELFNRHEEFSLVLSPEGTRKKVDRLRTGFYHIAKKAGVPVIMVAFDFGNKRAVIAEPFYPGDDEAADMQKVIQFYAPVQGRNAAQGLQHLLNNDQ